MKKRMLSILTAAVLAAGIFSTPVQTALGSVSAYADAATTVSAPTVSKKAGTYYVTSRMKLELSCATTGATIYYKVNDGSYKKYTEPFYITKNSTVKTYAKKNGVNSGVKTYAYKFKAKVTAAPDAGTYTGEQTVKLTTKASGVKIYYTTDGSVPTRSSALYTSAGIKISKTGKLRLLVTKTGWTGYYLTKNYTINGASLPVVTDEPQINEDLSILDDYTKKWGYSTLSAAQKKGYAKLFEAASTHAEKADLSDCGLVKSDIEKMYWAFDYDNPQFFWMGNGYTYSFYSSGAVISLSITYGRTASQASAVQKEFDKAANEIILKAMKYSSTADRVKVIHDEIVNRTEYLVKGGVYISEADGPLVYGKALCEGYSKAFAYLCQKIGVECICVGGYGNSESHMWNMVKVDGKWYHMDVTWDDPIGGKLRYNYYLLSEKDMMKDHTLDNHFAVPAAASTSYNG